MPFPDFVSGKWLIQSVCFLRVSTESVIIRFLQLEDKNGTQAFLMVYARTPLAFLKDYYKVKLKVVTPIILVNDAGFIRGP